MVDKLLQPDDAFSDLSGRLHSLAVGVGALAALVSLLCGTPVWVASLRGAVACVGIALVVRLGLRALRASAAADARRRAPPAREREAGPPAREREPGNGAGAPRRR